ncbi:hypothetical protein HNP02_002012 [Mycobacterium sp. AZCC_0083]|nr:hypothetical protein [Mycobacterium sp. AZCC_0083]
MEISVASLPPAVVGHHSPWREGQADTRIVETSRHRPQGSWKQPIVAMHELDAPAARVFQALVVVLVEADPSFIAYQPVSGPEHPRGDRDTVVRRAVVNDHDLELDALLIQDAPQTTFNGGAVVVHR